MNRVVARARFSKRTSLEEFDFAFQPSINKREVLDLRHMGFVENMRTWFLSAVLV